ncbi:electron transfer flavoprotein subunit alpha/FixB family protein [Massilia niastensis]|uniref:electron transfer flavoprotein subunit alpha/FixB family protein n=1 Tax=Massilia niastensis TaxID=544911 RepID=UPI00035E82CA|nr:FAD-binding protein [Massilia niastensis]
MAALVIAEHDHLNLKASTLHCVSAALACGAEVHVLVAGHDCEAAADAASRIAGVGRVLVAAGAQFEHGLAENVASQVLALAPGYSHILAPATAYGKNILPRVAALLDVAQISEITRVVAPDTFERPIYAGNAIAVVRSTDPVKVITVRATGFDAAGSGPAVPVTAVEPVAPDGGSRFVARELAASDRPELTAAKIIVSGGRGMGSGANFKILEPLADKLKAGMGASRAAVDAGFVPNDWQVGQTGKIVAPTLYIAVGISGAIQHLAGMKDSKVIVAINKDPEAPIFGVADYGIVGDLFDIVPQLAEAL